MSHRLRRSHNRYASLESDGLEEKKKRPRQTRSSTSDRPKKKRARVSQKAREASRSELSAASPEYQRYTQQQVRVGKQSTLLPFMRRTPARLETKLPRRSVESFMGRKRPTRTVLVETESGEFVPVQMTVAHDSVDAITYRRTRASSDRPRHTRMPR
jgi:hypothetical protein